MLSLTREQKAEAIATIYGYLSEGRNDREIMNEMGLSADDYKRLKVEFFDIKADELRTRPVEHTYVQYLIDQAANIKDLTELIEVQKAGRQANAIVGAIKARSDIQDKLIARGQEFGLIHKEASKHVVAGMLIGDLTNKQLRIAITTELEKLEKLTRRYGAEQSIKELSPPSATLHYGPKVVVEAEPLDDDDTLLPTKKSAPQPQKLKKEAKPSVASPAKAAPSEILDQTRRDRARLVEVKRKKRKEIPRRKAPRI